MPIESKKYDEMPPEHQQVAGDAMHVAANHLKMIELACRQLVEGKKPELVPAFAGAYLSYMINHIIKTQGPDNAEAMFADLIGHYRSHLAQHHQQPKAEKLKRGSLN